MSACDYKLMYKLWLSLLPAHTRAEFPFYHVSPVFRGVLEYGFTPSQDKLPTPFHASFFCSSIASTLLHFTKTLLLRACPVSSGCSDSYHHSGPRQRGWFLCCHSFPSMETRSESRFNRLQFLTSSYWKFRGDRRALYHKEQLTTMLICGLSSSP